MGKVLKIWIIAVGIFGFGVTKAVSQTKVTQIAELFSGRTHVSLQKDTLHYPLLKPLNYDYNKHYP